MKYVPLEDDDHAAIAMIPITSSSSNNSKIDSVYSTIAAPNDHSKSKSFGPTTSLQIQTPGKSPFSLPSPPKELETPIFSPTTGQPIYISIRPRRNKGNCRLVLASDHTSSAIACTTYRWGPSRNPVVRIGCDEVDLNANALEAEEVVEEFEMVRKSLLNRTVAFETRRWGRFEWRYAGRKEKAAYAADNLLVLESVKNPSGGGGKRRARVAQLVRNDAFRTPGTNHLAAGNGGRLQMDLVDQNGQEIIDEALVVVTCLVMLKKEVDRMRTMQAASMSTGGGMPAVACAASTFERLTSRLKHHC